MNTTKNIALHQLGISELKAYLLAVAFVIGNIALPQLCHLIPQGGLILLPIYFFTLIAAYKYGFTVGLLTAVLSPLVNNLLFGMPPSAAQSADGDLGRSGLSGRRHVGGMGDDRLFAGCPSGHLARLSRHLPADRWRLADSPLCLERLIHFRHYITRNSQNGCSVLWISCFFCTFNAP